MAIAAIDANVLVGLLDKRDKWHEKAVSIRDALKKADAEIIYFDCVLNEVISVLARRSSEQKRTEQFALLLEKLISIISFDNITWISGEIKRLYEQVLRMVSSSVGKLNFHDSLIALICREQDINVIVSFDQDFDQIDWLTRAGSDAELITTFQKETNAHS
ncbi:MAG: type II toxin-antitoxin system VapC family toxin [bacterium]|nr:type II toxin-antitoxin system VapC family toxin [bacterium]